MAVQDTIERNARKYLHEDEEVVAAFPASRLLASHYFSPLWVTSVIMVLGAPFFITAPLGVIASCSVAYYFLNAQNYAIIATNTRTLIATSGRSPAERVDEIVGQLPLEVIIEPDSWLYWKLELFGRDARIGRSFQSEIVKANARTNPTA